MQTLWQDLRYGARMLLRQSGFTLIAVLTLALGIGANAAIFNVVNNVLLRPLPYPQPAELVMVWESAPKPGFSHNDVASANFLDWRAQNTIFAHLAPFGSHSACLTGRGEPERIEGARVSASLFPLLGVAPALGRAFTEDEDRDGAVGEDRRYYNDTWEWDGKSGARSVKKGPARTTSDGVRQPRWGQAALWWRWREDGGR